MDILPFMLNKNVKIFKNTNNYVIMCLKREMTPGIYSKIYVKEYTWYTIELFCTKIGYGNPGLWIATPTKKTLFYGNYFTQSGRGYLKRDFFTGEYNCVLVGLLVNNATPKSGFVLEKFKITPSTNVLETNGNSDSYTDSLMKLNNLSEEHGLSEDNKCNQITDVNTDENKIITYTFDSIGLNGNINKIENDINGEVVDNINEIVIENDNKNENEIENDNDNEIENEIENEDNENYEEIEQKLIYNIINDNCDIKINIDIYTYPNFGFHIYPISLGIPKEYVSNDVPKKSIDFFPRNSGKSIIEQYDIDTFNKKEIYSTFEKSRFILITKDDTEYGEDCPIYYEALSKGCIPIFTTDINKNTSVFLPKELLNGIRNSNGINSGWIDAHTFSYAGYNKLSKYIIDYTQLYLTTENIATYLLHVTGKNVKNVLFLANSINGSDFLLQQSLLHGLKQKLGNNNVIDYPKILTMYKNNDIKHNTEIRMSLPYGHLLEESDVSRGRIDTRIQHHEFDIIIIMGIFTENDKKRLKINDGEYPYFNIISTYYDKSDILFIDGNCNTQTNIKNRLQKYMNSGICFSKEFA